ncbi:hypothetical protein B0H21DRAFT_415663 [Amylocystis lapponica]|nr:hypothetical protein B0H21DRAFT_415663 [Amylocystis lapponica]
MPLILQAFKWVVSITWRILTQSSPRLLLGRPLPVHGDPALLVAEGRIADLERDFRGAQASMDVLKKNEGKLSASLAECSRRLQDAEAELQQWQEGYREKDAENRKLHGQLRRALDDQKQAQQTTKEDKRTLTALRTQLNDTDTLLKARTLELKDAQQVFSKPDTLSDADILRLVGNLNSQIFQTAAQIADSLIFKNQKFALVEIDAEIDAMVKRTVGEEMLGLLTTVNHEGDPICIQIALQTCMVAFTGYIIETWNFLQRVDDDPFGVVYTNIARYENQSVSRRWRALTRSHLSQVYLQEKNVTALKESLAQFIANVLFTCGLGESLRNIYDTFVDKYGEKISGIVTLTLELRRSMGEEMVSCDLETVVAEGGEIYDAEVMDDAYSTGGARTEPNSAAAHILCTTEHGLRRVERYGDGINGELKSQVTMLLKPKVALESLAEELELWRMDTERREGSVAREVMDVSGIHLDLCVWTEGLRKQADPTGDS